MRILSTNTATALPINTKYKTNNPIEKWLIRQFMTCLTKIVGRHDFERVLDVGCGEGMVLRQLMHESLDRAKVYGVDLDPPSLSVAPQLAPNAHLSLANLYELPFPKKSFDVVLCTEVLEHLSDPASALIELRENTTCYALLTVPHEPYWRCANVLRGKYLSQLGNTPGHINHWGISGFNKFVRSQGYQVVHTEASGMWIVTLAEIR